MEWDQPKLAHTREQPQIIICRRNIIDGPPLKCWEPDMDERSDKAARYRERAEELKRAAKSVELGPETRRLMRELAENYEKLADLVETAA